MTNPTNNTPKTSPVKQFLKDYLWFLLLLAPLVVMPFLVMEKGSPKKRRVEIVQSQKTVFTKSVEVTSAQVAAIIVKPISELLQMEVYLPSASVAETEHYLVSPTQYSTLPQLLLSEGGNNITLEASISSIDVNQLEEHT